MIGAKIKSMREAKGYSQEFLAAELKMTQATVSRLESDIINCNLKNLKKIAELFEVSVDQLINGTK